MSDDGHVGAGRGTGSLDQPGLDESGVLDFTRELVRIPSVYDPKRGLDESRVADLVASRMADLGMDPVIDLVSPGRPNVVSVLDGGIEGPVLLFEGHTDVVTEGDAGGWSFDPFCGDLRDGYILGRGSADMKGGLAAMIYAAAAIRESGTFPGRIILAALVDEEGGMSGVKHFVASGRAKGVAGVIVCEPEAGEVCLTQKGAIRVLLTFRGVMSHGAMPQHGRNPLPPLARTISAIAGLEADLQARLGEDPYLGYPYLTPTVIAGGIPEQMNVIPASASLSVDIRTTPAVDHGVLLRQITRLAEAEAGSAGVSVEATVIDDRPPTSTAESSDVARSVMAAHEVVTSQPASLGGVPGTTDGTILWRDAHLPVVVYGPGGKWIAHQVDEQVAAGEVVQAAHVYEIAARIFLGGGPFPGPTGA